MESKSSLPLKSIIFGRVSSNFFWSLVNVLTGRGLFFFINIYFARRLGADKYGLFSISQAITYYLWFAVDLGTNMFGIREIARDKSKLQSIVQTIVSLRLTAAVIIFILYSIVILSLQMELERKVVLLSCSIYLITFAFYTDWIFKGLEKFKYLSLGSTGYALTFLIASLLFVKSDENVIEASFVWSLSYLVGCAFLIAVLRFKFHIIIKPIVRINDWISLLKESIYFTLSGSMALLYQYLPIFIVGYYFTSHDVGLFSAPYKIILAATKLGFILPVAFYPVLSDVYSKDLKEFMFIKKALIITMCVIGLITLVLGAIYKNGIVVILLGSQYENSIQVFYYLIWILPVIFIRFSYEIMLLSSGHQRAHNIAMISGVVSMISAGVILVPRFHLDGCAMAVLITEVIILMTTVLLYRRRIWSRHLLK